MPLFGSTMRPEIQEAVNSIMAIPTILKVSNAFRIKVPHPGIDIDKILAISEMPKCSLSKCHSIIIYQETTTSISPSVRLSTLNTYLVIHKVEYTGGLCIDDLPHAVHTRRFSQPHRVQCQFLSSSSCLHSINSLTVSLCSAGLRITNERQISMGRLRTKVSCSNKVFHVRIGIENFLAFQI